MHIHACHTTCMEVREQSDHMGLVTKLSLVIRLGVKNFYPLTGQGSFWYRVRADSRAKTKPPMSVSQHGHLTRSLWHCLVLAL